METPNQPKRYKDPNDTKMTEPQDDIFERKKEEMYKLMCFEKICKKMSLEDKKAIIEHFNKHTSKTLE